MTGNLLDLFFTYYNYVYIILSNDPFSKIDIHHNALEIEINVPILKNVAYEEITYNFNKPNYESIKNIFCEMQWNDVIISECNLDIALSKL